MEGDLFTGLELDICLGHRGSRAFAGPFILSAGLIATMRPLEIRRKRIFIDSRFDQVHTKAFSRSNHEFFARDQLLDGE
jgi:hypothetical protein